MCWHIFLLGADTIRGARIRRPVFAASTFYDAGEEGASQIVRRVDKSREVIEKILWEAFAEVPGPEVAGISRQVVSAPRPQVSRSCKSSGMEP